MPKFTVTVPEVHNAIYEDIRAENEAEAIAKVMAFRGKGVEENATEFSHTLDTDSWTAKKNASSSPANRK